MAHETRMARRSWRLRHFASTRRGIGAVIAHRRPLPPPLAIASLAFAPLLIALAFGAQAEMTADARPPAHPTRDVDVTYSMASGPRIVTERMRWQAATQRQRVDPPTEGLFIVIDYQAGRMSTVRQSDRIVLEMKAPAPDAPSGGSGTGGSYVRQGQDQVAGLACTEWEATASDGRRTVACITADGVTLRATTGGRTLFTAVSVDYAPQDAALFAVPAGFSVHRADAAQ
jgi:hypothetical protein